MVYLLRSEEQLFLYLLILQRVTFIIAYEIGYITDEDYMSLRLRVEEISRMLNALRNSQLKRIE